MSTTTDIAIDLVHVAAAAVPKAMAAFEESKKAVLAAAAAQQAAETRAENAKHDDDASVLVEAVENADLVMRRAKVAATVAASMAAACHQHYADMVHESLAAEHDAGLADRMTACRSIDAARAALAEGVAAFHAANGRLTRAYAAGRKRVFNGARLEPSVPFPVDEMPAGYWAAFEGDLWGQA